MTLSGAISGNDTITIINNGKGVPNSGKLLLTGNNADFTGTWNLSALSQKYPDNPEYLTFAEGKFRICIWRRENSGSIQQQGDF
jgi:hypothetical protein